MCKVCAHRDMLPALSLCLCLCRAPLSSQSCAVGGGRWAVGGAQSRVRSGGDEAHSLRPQLAAAALALTLRRAEMGHPAGTEAPKQLATRAIHHDAPLSGPEVAPNISVSTTFRHPSPAEIATKPDGYYDEDKFDPADPPRDIYSRYTQPTLTRAERVLETVIGQPTLVFPSGIAAFFAVLAHVRPDVVAISEGYHGCHASLQVYRNLRGQDNVVRPRAPFPSGDLALPHAQTPPPLPSPNPRPRTRSPS